MPVLFKCITCFFIGVVAGLMIAAICYISGDESDEERKRKPIDWVPKHEETDCDD